MTKCQEKRTNIDSGTTPDSRADGPEKGEIS